MKGLKYCDGIFEIRLKRQGVSNSNKLYIWVDNVSINQINLGKLGKKDIVALYASIWLWNNRTVWSFRSLVEHNYWWIERVFVEFLGYCLYITPYCISGFVCFRHYCCWSLLRNMDSSSKVRRQVFRHFLLKPPLTNTFLLFYTT